MTNGPEFLTTELKQGMTAELLRPIRLDEAAYPSNLVFSAWYQRGLFKYYVPEFKNRLDVSQQTTQAVSLVRIDDHKMNLANLYRDNLQEIGFPTILDFLYTSYSGCMSRLEAFVYPITAESGMVGLLPNKQEEFIMKFMKGDYRIYGGTHKRFTQKDLAEFAGISQAWVSNLVSGDKTRFYVWLDFLDHLPMPQDVKQAAMQKYANDQNFAKVGGTKRLFAPTHIFGNVWRDELTTLNRGLLENNSFTCAEEFLFIRFCNAVDKIVTASRIIQDSPENLPTEDLIVDLRQTLNLWPLGNLNQRDQNNPHEWMLYIDAWMARGLLQSNFQLNSQSEIDNQV